MSTPMPDAGELEPSTLPLAQLRALRSQLQHEDDAISYVRRLAQARLDLVRAEMHHRAAGDEKNITGELPAILGTHLIGGPARPCARPTTSATITWRWRWRSSATKPAAPTCPR